MLRTPQSANATDSDLELDGPPVSVRSSAKASSAVRCFSDRLLRRALGKVDSPRGQTDSFQKLLEVRRCKSST